jgi:hypothetical protein
MSYLNLQLSVVMPHSPVCQAVLLPMQSVFIDCSCNLHSGSICLWRFCPFSSSLISEFVRALALCAVSYDCSCLLYLGSVCLLRLHSASAACSKFLYTGSAHLFAIDSALFLCQFAKCSILVFIFLALFTLLSNWLLFRPKMYD